MKKLFLILSATTLLLSCSKGNEQIPTDATATESVQKEEPIKDSAQPADTAPSPETGKENAEPTLDNAPAEQDNAPAEQDNAPAENNAKGADNAQDSAAQAPAAQENAAPETSDKVIKIALYGEKEFVSEGLKPATKHAKLKLKKEKSYGEWLDSEKWLEENGFSNPRYPYSDDQYTYECDASGGENQYDCHSLIVRKKDGTRTIYDFSDTITSLIQKNANREYQYYTHISYATIVNDTLYVQFDGSYHAADDNTFIMALDLDGKILWRSRKRVSNGRNFVITNNTIITGFGSSFDPDFIYTLDAQTGKLLDTIPVKKAVEYIILKDGTLHVATYNRVYTYSVN